MAHFFTTQHTTNALCYDIHLYELNEHSASYPQEHIEGSSINLKHHQRTLLQRCISLENDTISLSNQQEVPNELTNRCHPQDTLSTKIGILADRVGSGKSYVILSLISVNRLYRQHDVLINSYGMNNVVFTLHRDNCVTHTNMLVIPHNLVTQWIEYLSAFPNLRYCLVTKKVFDNMRDDEFDIGSYDILLVTSTYYNKVAQHISDKNVTFQRVIYDEVDHLSIPSSRSISAKFIWFITASYGNILYPKGFRRWEQSLRRDIWSAQGILHSGFIKILLMDIFCRVPRELSKLLVVKNVDSFVERSIMLPPIEKHYVACKTPLSIRVLNGIVERNIIECLNGNNIQGAMANITSSHKSTESNIIELMIQKYTIQLSNLEMKFNHTREYHYDTETERQQELDRIQKKIDDATEKVRMIRQRIVESDTCVICYDDIRNKTVTQCCQNSFCFKCITSWLAKSSGMQGVCPLCKLSINMDSLFVVDNTEVKKSITAAPPPTDVMGPYWDKYTNLKIMLRNRQPNSKFLIFSNYDDSFLSLYKVFEEAGICYEHLKGNGNVVKCTVDRYKNGAIDVLLVNSSHYGSGLNLENTTDIVMFHKFDTEIEKQVIGRADRFGRSGPLNVWYLLYDNEMS